MKNLLITGGAGFIGSNFIRHILQLKPDVFITNLDALTYAGNLVNLSDLPDSANYEFVHGNINDTKLLKTIFNDKKIDTVVNFAAESHVDRSILNPAAFIETNILGTYSLLNVAHEAWKHRMNSVGGEEFRFHHISTDEVYGSLQPDDTPFNEYSRYDPRSPYSASKASSDHLVRAYHHTYHLPITITNCSNNYGPYQHPEKFIPMMIINAIQGKRLPIYGDGLQVRDWIHVSDHCEAIYRVLLNGLNGATYNLGSGSEHTNLEIAGLICDTLDTLLPNSVGESRQKLLQHIPDRPGHDRRYAMDITFVKENLGWQPAISLTDGIMQTVKWYLEHIHWIQEITKNADFSRWVQLNYDGRDERTI